MNAPRRLLDEDTSGLERDLERDVLRAGLVIDPPEGAQEAVWAGILAALPVPPPPAQGSAGGGKAAAGKAAAAAKVGGAGAAGGGSILSAVLIGAGSAVVCIAAYAVVTPSTPEPSPPPPMVAPSSEPGLAPSPPSPPVARPTPGEPAAAASPSADPSADRRAPAEARAADPAAERETLLREESRLVGEARAALRRGDAAAALGMLDQIRERFPGGVLAQEREALSIEALARSGRRDEAAARAAAFVKAYPASPLAAGVQGFAN
jgi:hypothetical protein